MKRSCYCGEITEKYLDKEVILYGWVDSKRDHGGVTFIDLRDREGKVQVVFSEENEEIFTKAQELKSEYVVLIKGKVRRRPPGTENPKLKTGEFEVVASSLEILNTSLTPPFEISEFANVSEDVKLQYRYLDLRRERMKKNLIIRHKFSQSVRKFLSNEGFIEIETPFLSKSTPEGARDYLVPSRLNPGTFYALPQSPQLFKQLLIISGFDRYFQIVRCFRDEDLRADRQPEFTQIDIEMSFVDEADVMEVTERMLYEAIKETLGIEITLPFPKMTYKDAISLYGSDKPDIRSELKIHDVTEAFLGTNFRVFSDILHIGGKIKMVKFKQNYKFSVSDLDMLTQFVKSIGAKGLVWIEKSNGKVNSNILKFITEEQLKKINIEENEIAFLIADTDPTKFIGLLIQELNRKYIKKEGSSFLWVYDFPLFEYSETENRWVSKHHPFTAPIDEHIDLIDKLLHEPNDEIFTKIKAKAYDLILNGVEIGGGSIRIHKKELQKKIFKILKIPEIEIEQRFGFLLRALEYGAPPHGGIAIGYDRLLAVLLGEDSIRDVIAFPKTQKGICPLTQTPSTVDDTQLKELRIEIRK